MRDVAVPLPTDLPQDDDSQITLRLSGGSGFWQFDQVGLSTLREADPPTRRVIPTAVTNDEGVDQSRKQWQQHEDGRKMISHDRAADCG